VSQSLPDSVRAINRLSDPEKVAIYRQLIPDWLLDDYQIDPVHLTYKGQSVLSLICPNGSRAVELILRRNATDKDPLMYFNMADTFNNQLLVLLVVINDPDSPRYNIDIDQNGNNTHFGTSLRNIPAEIAAMHDGLAPGQVRRGLRVFKRSVPIFESFISRMSHDMFLIEPLAYHNAIVFERYGFSYSRGLKDMQEIHREFQPSGYLHQRLNNKNEFRSPNAWQSVRGRSWAIHDGILGHPFTGFQMYKRIGIHAGIQTFPDFVW
jgi:hypothetical protein